MEGVIPKGKPHNVAQQSLRAGIDLEKLKVNQKCEEETWSQGTPEE